MAQSTDCLVTKKVLNVFTILGVMPHVDKKINFLVTCVWSILGVVVHVFEIIKLNYFETKSYVYGGIEVSIIVYSLVNLRNITTQELHGKSFSKVLSNLIKFALEIQHIKSQMQNFTI